MRSVCIILIVCISFRNLTLGSAENITHANTTRLCRNNCKLSSVPFQQPFLLPSNCGSVSSFYGCSVEIDVNYTRHTVTVTFSGHTEDSTEMYLVDYNHSVDIALNLAFYRNIFTSTVIFTCLTQDYCTDQYTSIVVQQLIDSESILYKLLPIYLDKSLDNRTITCINTTNDEIPCYGGYCESITEEIVSDWSFHECGYPSELSVLSTTELTSLTAFFVKYEPENSATDHVNNTRMTLLCNVDLCNSQETRNQGKVILEEYNQAAFDFIKNDTVTTTREPFLSTTTLRTTTLQITTLQTTCTTSISSSSSFISTLLTNQSTTDESIITSSESPPFMLNNGDFENQKGIRLFFYLCNLRETSTESHL
jgi:hypothetical protein